MVSVAKVVSWPANAQATNALCVVPGAANVTTSWPVCVPPAGENSTLMVQNAAGANVPVHVVVPGALKPAPVTANVIPSTSGRAGIDDLEVVPE